MWTCPGIRLGLEQRIGRIKRIGQTRDRVDMLNLVYHDTNDEKVYGVLSKRMKDRYDLFGSLPDTIEDDWIEDVEHLEEHLRQFTERKREPTHSKYATRAASNPTDQVGNNASESSHDAMWWVGFQRVGRRSGPF